MRKEDYERLPASLEVREVRYQVAVKGFRTREVILSTTLLDAAAYPAEALAELYFQRWQIEVDFRHLKTTTQMDVLRGYSPNVVEKEFWAHVLAYNLIRRLMWEAGAAVRQAAMTLSVKGAIQHLIPHWPLSRHGRQKETIGELLALVAAEKLPQRPGRMEPRVKKRRPKNYRLMTQPRDVLKNRMTA